MTANEVQSDHATDLDHEPDHALDLVRVSNAGTNGASTRPGRRSGSGTNSTTKSTSTTNRDKSILVDDDTKALVVDAAATTGRSHNSVVRIAMAYYAATKGWERKLTEEEWVEAQLRDLR